MGLPKELPNLLVFASGGKKKGEGGSGFKNLVLASHQNHLGEKVLNAKIIGVACNHLDGGVEQKAHELNIPFYHFPGPWTKEGYQSYVRILKPDFIALSGWMKLTVGLDPKTTFNIHPGPLPGFGGKGMHGRHVHEAVLQACREGKITDSAVSMHFVTDQYDQGPVFFHFPVGIRPVDSVDDIAGRVNLQEHWWQPIITNLVVSGQIYWDGKDPASLSFPSGYEWLVPQQD